MGISFTDDGRFADAADATAAPNENVEPCMGASRTFLVIEVASYPMVAT